MNIRNMTGAALLLARIVNPSLASAIDAELDRRARQK